MRVREDAGVAVIDVLYAARVGLARQVLEHRGVSRQARADPVAGALISAGAELKTEIEFLK